jgi:TPR repeat protein
LRPIILGLAGASLVWAMPALGGTFEGINAFNAADYKTARTELAPAAKAGDPHAVYYLGRLYAAGLGGLKKDPARAAKLYRQAAEAGIPEAQHALGIALSLGEGVDQDFVESLTWFMLAAKAGNQSAKQFGDRIAAYMTREMVLEARRKMRAWEEKNEAKAQ